MITWLHDASEPLPPTQLALPAGSEAPGLLAIGGELTPARLAEAYGKGVFPWYSEGQPILWWTPDPRMVLYVDEFKLSRSLRKTVRRFAFNPDCELRIDSDFRAVITACANVPRDGQAGTWIVPEMIEAYCRWHARGAVHSFEAWVEGRLVGGLYGISLGRMFFGESMFSHRADASKIAMAGLIGFCRLHGITLIDCQQRTSHLASLGGREIARSAFEAEIASRIRQQPVKGWAYDPDIWARLNDLPAQDPGP